MFIQTNNYVKRPLSWENRTVTLTFTSFFSLPIPHMDMSNTHYRLVPFEIMDNFFELYNCREQIQQQSDSFVFQNCEW